MQAEPFDEPVELDCASSEYPVTSSVPRRGHPQYGIVLGGRSRPYDGEGACMRALRWLKLQQNPDGSWPGEPTSMTGLAILAFLGHGDTPNPDCVEFGPAVEKAIRYLVENQNEDGTFKSKDPDNYAHPIATYALCEAYILTKVPMVKVAAEKALIPIIRSQNSSGGWDLNLKQTGMNNTSYMGWCAQALKYANMAGDLEVEGLDAAYTNAVNGFKANAHADGGFGETGKGQSEDSSAGVLCLQLLGASRSEEVRMTLSLLDSSTFSFAEWEQQPIRVESPISYWYYLSQAEFHAGGEQWKRWNKLHWPELVDRQMIITNAIADADGRMRDVGYWDSPSKNEHHFGSGGDIIKVTHYEKGVPVDGTTTLGGRVQDTCLSVLPIVGSGVRYLPTFRTPIAEESEVDLTNETDDIEIKIIR